MLEIPEATQGLPLHGWQVAELLARSFDEYVRVLGAERTFSGVVLVAVRAGLAWGARGASRKSFGQELLNQDL